MTFQPFPAITASALLLTLLALSDSSSAQSKSSKYACSEPNPAQLCTAANSCGSASSPCTVDVKRTSNAASATPGISNATANALFCVKAGTTVKWISTEKENGFVVDVGPSSPFDPARGYHRRIRPLGFCRGETDGMLQVFRRCLPIGRNLRHVWDRLCGTDCDR
jgi:hypothetical protein